MILHTNIYLVIIYIKIFYPIFFELSNLISSFLKGYMELGLHLSMPEAQAIVSFCSSW
jgi:hypothetical protein